jgi:Kelch motif
MTLGRLKGCMLGALAALLIVPASAGAVNQVSFSQVGNMTAQREYPGAARLPDGRILVVGGYDGDYLNSAEVFDPTTNSFSPLGATLSDTRYAPVAASLPDGRVLVAGGYDDDTAADVASAEVFNPSTGTFSPVGSMTRPREEAGAAALPDGRILVAGGYDNGTTLDSTEIFDPNTNTFSPGPSLPYITYGPAAASLSGGILVAGGYDGDYLSPAFVFSSTSNTFGPVGSLPSPTWAAAGASLPQGRALVAGGHDGNDPLARALIFDPATNAFSSAGIGNLIQARDSAAAAELTDGRVLVAGGDGDTDELNTAELLSVPSNAFKAKLKGRRVVFAVTNEGVGQVTDVSTKLATTAKKKGKKKPKLVKTKTRHGGPGKIVVKVKLTKLGAARLAQKGKIRIRIAYTPDQGLAATRKLKLRAGK